MKEKLSNHLVLNSFALEFSQHESEILPFPNAESDFTLPNDDYGDMMKTKTSGSTSAGIEDSKAIVSKNVTMIFVVYLFLIYTWKHPGAQ